LSTAIGELKDNLQETNTLTHTLPKKTYTFKTFTQSAGKMLSYRFLDGEVKHGDEALSGIWQQVEHLPEFKALYQTLTAKGERSILGQDELLTFAAERVQDKRLTLLRNMELLAKAIQGESVTSLHSYLSSNGPLNNVISQVESGMMNTVEHTMQPHALVKLAQKESTLMPLAQRAQALVKNLSADILGQMTNRRFVSAFNGSGASVQHQFTQGLANMLQKRAWKNRFYGVAALTVGAILTYVTAYAGRGDHVKSRKASLNPLRTPAPLPALMPSTLA